MPVILSPRVSSNPLWTSQAELYAGFGKLSVDKWADLDGSGNTNIIAGNVQAAAAAATDDAQSRLRGASCGVITSAPLMLRVQVTRLAATLLYTGKGVKDTADEEGKHRLSWSYNQAIKWLNGVVAGKIRLNLGVTGISRVPIVGCDRQPYGSQYGPMLTPQEILMRNRRSELSGVLGYNLWWDGFDSAGSV